MCFSASVDVVPVVPSEVWTFLVADGRAVFEAPCAGAFFLDLNRNDMMAVRPCGVYVHEDTGRRIRSDGTVNLISC